jgi:hypothetical protein
MWSEFKGMESEALFCANVFYLSAPALRAMTLLTP